MFCSKCGKEIKDDSKYCPYCGTKIDLKDSDVYDSKKTIYDQRIKVDTNGYEFNIEDKKKFYFKYFLIGMIPFFGMIYLKTYMLQKDKERAKLTSLYIGMSTLSGLIFIAILIVFIIIFTRTAVAF